MKIEAEYLEAEELYEKIVRTEFARARRTLDLATANLKAMLSEHPAGSGKFVSLPKLLGARAEEVTQMVTRQGFVLAMGGVAVGLGCALVATRVMSGLLFEVSATDPWTFSGVALTMAAVAWLASYLPARRTSRVDPIEALRVE